MASTGPGFGMAERPPAVLCDFDDTVALQNVAALILDRFYPGSREGLRRQLQTRVITFREYQEEAFSRAVASRQEMEAHVQSQATLRSGFVDLWRYCQANSFPLSILSVGLEFYIKALLHREGIDRIAVYAAEVDFAPKGMQIRYSHVWNGCNEWGICKCSVLESYRARGYRIIYAGDGGSDLCPARRADAVFARSELAKRCTDTGLPFIQLDDFHVVRRFLENCVPELGTI